MKQVEQTILTAPEGNCFAACVASILELPIDSVPNFRSEGEGWWKEWQVWLAPRSLALMGWGDEDLGDSETRADTLRGYSICTVRYEYPSGGLNHSTVALDGKIVWNPHPLRDTKEHDSVKDWVVFRALDPSKVNTLEPRFAESTPTVND